ncbi:hypothetical protein [Treponema sp. C6A8]|uniref:hypothetical protein n=1 Tax=Treponema sp. C6A8 TaxID=1410609 RepID=UPI00048831EB|nr:hypothetical protein [Treponema sp. C6A8]
MQLIEITGKKIKLSSGMTEEAFAKTRFASLLTEKGIIAQCGLTDGKEIPEELEFSFSEWNFDSIKSETDVSGKSIVFYEGTFDFMEENAPSAAALADLSESNDPNYVKAATLICAAIRFAAHREIRLPQNGGGILISFGTNKANIIFLPEEIFFNSVPAADDKIFSRYIGFYRIPLLNYSTSILFTQAVITYRLLTGQFPFAKENPDERFADIMDKNFLPVEYAVEGIDKETADLINRAISQRPYGTLKERLYLHDNLFKLILNHTSKSKDYTVQNSESFKKRSEEYLKAKNSRLDRKRMLKKNSTKILAVAAAILIVWMFAVSIVKSNLSQPTTIGLSPTQVTECFFQAINEKDVQLMMAASKGTPFKSYLTAITNMHVADAASQAYTFTSQNQKPEKWFFYAKDKISDSNTSVWGISNLVIDGYKSQLDAVPTTKKARPAPYKNDGDLSSNSTTTLNVSYYMVETNTETGELKVEYTTGDLILSWHKNRWLLTGIDVQAEPLSFDTAEFKSEYYEALAAENDDVVKAVDRLRFRYQWVPSHTVMENQEKILRAGF